MYLKTKNLEFDPSGSLVQIRFIAAFAAEQKFLLDDGPVSLMVISFRIFSMHSSA